MSNALLKFNACEVSSTYPIRTLANLHVVYSFKFPAITRAMAYTSSSSSKSYIYSATNMCLSNMSNSSLTDLNVMRICATFSRFEIKPLCAHARARTRRPTGACWARTTRGDQAVRLASPAGFASCFASCSAPSAAGTAACA